MIEAWGTGIQKMQLETEGYPEIELSIKEIDNAFQIQFVNIMYEEAYEEAYDDLSKLELKIISILKEKDVNIQELLSGCGYSTRTGNFKKSLAVLIETGFVEMTLPDKPRSKKQKYRLTGLGRMRL